MPRLTSYREYPAENEPARFFSNKEIFGVALVASTAIATLMSAANARIGRSYNAGAMKQFVLDHKDLDKD